MNNSTSDVVVVGAGLAAALVAETLRDQGFTGRVTLVGDEPHLPYERPPLSKGYLMGTVDRDSVFVHTDDWYAEHEVDLRLGATGVGLERGARAVVLADGERLPYGSLVLATGARPRQLEVPGSGLANLHYLRRIEDSERLREAFSRATSVAVIGGGWIGLESAAAARSAGLAVTVLHRGSLPLLGALGPEMARVFADLHREHGVVLREADVVGLTGDRAVTGVRLADGAVIAADLVLVGIGVTPRSELAEAADLEVADGVLVDEHLRTADPDVYAVGDVARVLSPRLGRRRRVEHWENARRQGALVAAVILGQDAVDDRPSYVFSDQYDLGMEYTGDVETGASCRVVVRGDLAARELVAFWLDGDRVLAGMNVNVWDVAGQIEALVLSGRDVDVARLADPDVPLDTL